MSAPQARRGSYATLLRNPGYLRVFSAGLGSVAGSAISTICLVWIVYASTRSALDVALLGTSWLVAGISFSVFGGALVDRYDRRRLMILSDAVRAAAMATVAGVLFLHGFDLGTILAAYFLVGAFTTVFNPAEQAIVPALVEPSLVADANGLVRSSRSALQFVGTSVAGVLIISVGPTTGVAVNAATYALSAVLLVGMHVAGRQGGAPSGARASGSYFSEIRAGFRWLWNSKGFFQLTVSALFFNTCFAVIGTFLVIFATVVLHGSALVYALLLAAEVAGIGIGSLLVSPLHGERYAGRAWVIPYGILAALATISFVVFPTVPVALAGLFFGGLLSGFAGTSWLTAAQLLVPSEMQGRYFGIDNLGSVATIPVAQIGGALLIGAYGVSATFLGAATVWLVVGLVFLVPRPLWNLGYRGRAPSSITLRSDAGEVGTSESPEGTRVA